ncbi:plasma-membrane choline transporter-domain-containing protein [Polychytrium aggregatum]|uniref:plasma-membrane choline transporter-domain-containing protein n=1 Tax=Polychytrium aggregatum TaxID=110093 RepID=UPI0022FE7CC1|nr:plasma-membrane choline transporter-domain-containing protein [Polychytrium aggregatum]KAI9202888.1 plasma-membrane choline transporter-domain-containing protein [Polychytrium aggregatum]
MKQNYEHIIETPQQSLASIGASTGVSTNALVSSRSLLASAPPRPPAVEFIEKKRRCHDVFFLLLYLVFWIGLVWLTTISIRNGNPAQLLIPTDYLGQSCGVNNTAQNASKADFTHYPYAYFLDPLDILNFPQICVKTCPDQDVLANLSNAICVYGYPRPTTQNELSFAIQQRLCAPYIYAGEPLLGRCVPSQPIPSQVLQSASQNITVGSTVVDFDVGKLLAQGKTLLAQVMADVSQTWSWLVGGVFIAVLVSGLWLVGMRWFAGPFVWLSVVISNLAVASGAVVLAVSVKMKNDDAVAEDPTLSGLDPSLRGLLAATIVVAIIALILMAISLALRKEISLAIEVIKEAALAIQRMPSLVVFPFMTWAIGIALIAHCLIVFAYLASLGSTFKITDFGLSLQNPSLPFYLEIYHFFGFLWNWAFLSGFHMVSLAGAFGEYYWARNKSNLRYPLAASVGRALRYHLGSIAIGSLQIAVIQVLSLIMFFLHKRATESRFPVTNFCMACLDSFLKTIRRILQYIDKKVYIHIATKGKSFCRSTDSVLGLLVRNASHTVPVGFVTEFMLLLGAINVTFISGLIAWGLLSWQADNVHVVSILTPTVLIGLEALMISYLFLSVYHMGIDTLFLCFLEDFEVNDGSEARPYSMSKRLMRIGHVVQRPSKEEEAACRSQSRL